MKLKEVGFFKEIHYDEKEISLVHSTSHKKNNEEDNIINYLTSGHILVATGTVNYDYFDKTTTIDPPNIYTDGIWVWPGDFHYYIKKYHVNIPDEFLKHMKDSNWEIPKEIKENTLELGDLILIRDENGLFSPKEIEEPKIIDSTDFFN